MYAVLIYFVGGGNCVLEFTSLNAARKAAKEFAEQGLEYTCETGYIRIPSHRVLRVDVTLIS